MLQFSRSVALASLVKDKVSIGAWIYLWAFCFVPLTYISVFVPVPYCLDDYGFVVEPELRQIDSSSSILLSQDCFGYSRFCGVYVPHLFYPFICQWTFRLWKSKFGEIYLEFEILVTD